VVVAAGSSVRMGGRVRKPYLKLCGRPLLAWTVERLARAPGLRQVVVVIRPQDARRAARAVQLARLPARVQVTFVHGGPRRQDSVHSGLRATSATAEVVLIHDAARPFPPLKAMQDAVECAARHGGAILALPVRDTVKQQDGARRMPGIARTVPRAGLWLAQTPQVFRRALALELFERLAREAPRGEVTDDAAVCERFGRRVLLVPGSATNLKITNPEDLRIAAALLSAGRTKG
jgi:2-C-methyl-D-erythritol 4-phosphate cytidylyltransferase